MKVRVCPDCGKHNPENVVNCGDCGTTLSMNTLLDLDKPKAMPQNLAPLSKISPFFDAQKREILKTIEDGFEEALWGCNITQISRKPPYRFGFVIITTKRLILVYFNSETNGLGNPSRAHFEFTDAISGNPIKSLFGSMFRQETGTVFALEDPQEALSSGEAASCEILEYNLNNLASSNVKKNWLGEILLEDVVARFRQGETLNITFCLPEHASKLHNLLIEALM